MGIMDRSASSLGHVGGMPNKSIRSPRAHRLCHRSKRYRAHGKDQQKKYGIDPIDNSLVSGRGIWFAKITFTVNLNQRKRPLSPP